MSTEHDIIFQKVSKGGVEVKVRKHRSGNTYLDIESFYKVQSGEYVSHTTSMELLGRQPLELGRALILAHSVTA